MALAFEKGEKETMKESPRKKEEPIIDREMKGMIAIISIVSNLVMFGIFLYYLKTTGDIALTRSITFAALGVNSLFFIFSIRSKRHMVWQMNPFSNKYVVYSVLLGIALLIGGIYLPFLQTFLDTVSISWKHWLVVGLFGVLNILLIELIKGIFLVRKHRKILSFKS
jgi:Ca2+-transporting ATPase